MTRRARRHRPDRRCAAAGEGHSPRPRAAATAVPERAGCHWTISAGLGLLLVLVDESSTTPHLLRRSGAIYVRSPASSDPVPITDQATLLELTRRGVAARENAEERARWLTRDDPERVPPYQLGLAAPDPARPRPRSLHARALARRGAPRSRRRGHPGDGADPSDQVVPADPHHLARSEAADPGR